MSHPAKTAYRLIEDWEQLPAGRVHRDVADVTVDSEDRVYLFTRMDPGVIVYDSDGTHVTSWGEDSFTPRPHGITAGWDGIIYCVDEFDQTIRTFTPEGEPIGVIGESGVASDTGIDWSHPYKNFREQEEAIVRGGGPFNHPTKAALAPNGDVYVSDGYGNARVHHFSPDGSLIRSWGEPGSGPGEFRAPHCVAVHNDLVWVCDRDNERIQIFETDGTLVDEWTQVQRPSSIAFDKEGLIYVTEQGWKVGDHSWRNGPIEEALSASVCILASDGSLVERLGAEEGFNFHAPHGLAVDSQGSIYVAEVLASWFRPAPVPEGTHTLQKLARA